MYSEKLKSEFEGAGSLDSQGKGGGGAKEGRSQGVEEPV
jgi:hypothetical protein